MRVQLLPPSHLWLLALLITSSSHLGNGVTREGLALLAFKASISEDPYGSLHNWNSSDPSPCSWNGINCRDGTVVSLTIPRRSLVGSLPPSLGSLPFLRHVNLRSNRLHGSLPPEFFSARGLQSLVLYGNSMAGPLPPEVGNLSNLQILDISKNIFYGSVPPSLLKCSRLKVLDLSSNSFYSSLPSGMGNSFDALERLNLSYNQFNGSIPDDIGNLSNLRDTVDFSHNFFSGSIPPGLGNLPEKVYIDLTFNNLSGPIPQNGALVSRGPTAFVGNPQLCGPPLKEPCSANAPAGPRLQAGSTPPDIKFSRDSSGRRGLNRAAVVAIVASDALAMGLIALVFFYCYRRAVGLRGRDGSGDAEKVQKCSKECLCFRKEELRTPSDNAEQVDLVPLDRQVNFDLDELLKASAFVLGKSGIGIVYRVVLEDGLNLVVRRLGEGGSQRFKEFQSEVEAIGKVRHPNIVALRAYYWSMEEKLLIYDYIPNGNLSSALHGKAEMAEYTPLSWQARLNIMIGVAKGLTYLHEVSPKKYVHGDLKTSNILLGPKMVPHISNFGVGRLASLAGGSPTLQSNRMAPEKPRSQPSDIMISPVMGTAYCYQAPESLKTLKPSQKWDIYSYGVILLELISGRQPIVQLGNSEITLVQWVKFCIDEKKPLIEVLDPCLIHEPEREEEMIEALKIALACVQTNPERRPLMRHVLESLEKLTTAL